MTNCSFRVFCKMIKDHENILSAAHPAEFGCNLITTPHVVTFKYYHCIIYFELEEEYHYQITYDGRFIIIDYELILILCGACVAQR